MGVIVTKQIQFLDSTLREGEQVPGVWFTPDEKRALFKAIEAAGIDIIDMGIPATSREDEEFCRRCAAEAAAWARICSAARRR